MSLLEIKICRSKQNIVFTVFNCVIVVLIYTIFKYKSLSVFIRLGNLIPSIVHAHAQNIYQYIKTCNNEIRN